MTDLSSLVNEDGKGLNTLLLGPTLNETTTETHYSLLNPDDHSPKRLLFITYRKTPDALITEWRNQTVEGPKQIGIISMGNLTPGSQAQLQQSPKPTAPVWVETIPSPGDLTALGIRYNKFLDIFNPDTGRLVVCFDSITALLQYVDEKVAYRFLQMATGQFRESAALTHFHLDPDAHAAQTVAKFKTLFDAVVDVSDEKVIVRTR